jgi:hypothetical protein
MVQKSWPPLKNFVPCSTRSFGHKASRANPSTHPVHLLRLSALVKEVLILLVGPCGHILLSNQTVLVDAVVTWGSLSLFAPVSLAAQSFVLFPQSG